MVMYSETYAAIFDSTHSTWTNISTVNALGRRS